MITLQEVEEALAELEDAPGTFDTAIKLATFLQLREHLTYGENNTVQRALVDNVSVDSDFMRAAVKGDPRTVWKVLDELMETVRITTPRVYEAVMRKLLDSGK